MCGIVYAKSFKNKPINRRIFDQFKAQRSRGTQGFGIYDKEYDNIIKNPDENGILKYLNNHPSTEIMFHHRFPTSTENVKNACHPFSTGKFFKNNYVLVHNGVISNPKEMHTKHEALGIKYSSMQPDGDYNDSEALLWEVALFLEGQQEEIEAKGSIAFICIKNDEKGEDKLFYARNTSPLKMWRSNKGIMLSSEGQGTIVPSYELHTYDYNTHRITSKDLVLPTYSYTPPKYKHHISRKKDWNRDHKIDGPLRGGYYASNTGEFVPWDVKYPIKEIPVLDLDEPDPTPTLSFPEEVSLIYDEYLERSDGNFEDMWWLLSNDIEMLTDMMEEDIGVSEELRKLEFTLDRLANEPKFNDKNKIHPKWFKARFLAALAAKSILSKETENA